MNILLRKCISFVRIPFREKLWLFWLFLLSGLIRACLLVLPFRCIAPWLGLHHQNYQLASVTSEQQKLMAWRIGRITELAASYTPWQSKCLVQAMAAKVLLAHYRIPYVLHLGVTKAAGQSFDALKAHAWLSVGPWIITGREGHRAFTIISTFVAPSILNPGTASCHKLHAD
ncbi:MAG: hypothetical protein BMS9Abin18_1326 [Zetaproteobacteria bacterium]|nr:MAG: hypothetical protein BMS9Abin18_1326 [Zetaproteobacteria bacterium]